MNRTHTAATPPVRWGLTRPDDPTEDKIRRWEAILGDVGFDRIEAAARILACADVLAEAMDRIAQTEGLANRNDYQALSILRWAKHEGHQLTVTDLATALGDTTATTANRIARLHTLGYINRLPHPTDRRSHHITITTAGAATAERMVLARTSQREQWLSALTDPERATLATLLTKLAT